MISQSSKTARVVLERLNAAGSSPRGSLRCSNNNTAVFIVFLGTVG